MKLGSKGPGRFWSKYVDIYWGERCRELYDCAWCIQIGDKLTIEWDAGV